ncbi:ribonucleotide-diphosphate reductase subunit beta [Halorarius halobius]|uniref:ribonucleotide-diphosphate reductase subunit beta n=1 Tax=Halorarius halobius TaxID=2962671 RepID=UPI0020CEC73A|nr:ribonucleotide-diphosphate reductase subunit beta [Halorarius halobius]
MSRKLRLERSDRSFRYYRNAVERHWDPAEIDLSGDAAGLVELDDDQFDGFRAGIAKFGAGEEAVTEDLAPLAVVLDEPEEEMFLTTQLYEEAKHTDFFDRYWREVIHPAEDERGVERSSPHADEWFDDDYVELFDRMADAMDRLLVEDTPETRAEALCHYHLTIEGILAQTAYYGLQTTYSDRTDETPNLDGLCAGMDLIRRDEGRHVGFGMLKLKQLVREEGVDPQLLHDTVNELVPLVNGITTASFDEDDDEEIYGPGPEDLTAYATGKHTQRMKQITSASADIPDVETLTQLEGD